MMLYEETITPELKRSLNRLMAIRELEPFRLVGGTALALMHGHRSSVDIDLFAAGFQELRELPNILRKNLRDDFQLIVSMQNGISGVVDGVKVDIFDWKVPFTEDAIIANGIRMASPADIFAYKCEAILSRRSEKDFCDLGMLMGNYSLDILISAFRKRYPFISTGSVFPILLKEEVIEKDPSIVHLKNNTFEKYAILIKEKLKEYEQTILDKKTKGEEERILKIKALIQKKKSSDNNSEQKHQ